MLRKKTKRSEAPNAGDDSPFLEPSGGGTTLKSAGLATTRPLGQITLGHSPGSKTTFFTVASDAPSFGSVDWVNKRDAGVEGLADDGYPKDSQGHVEANVDSSNDKVQATADAEAGQNLVAHHPAHFRQDPYQFLRHLGQYYSGTSWRGYQTYIGGRVFYPGYAASQRLAVITSPAIQTVIAQLIDQRLAALDKLGQLPKSAQGREQMRLNMQNQVLSVAEKMTEEMVAKMDDLNFIRTFAFLINNILVRMYHQGIHVSARELDDLRATAAQAEKDKVSLIFLPCHKSHIDYLTISFVMFRIGLSLPHIVAGENLNIPVLGPMLQRAGAFYIRRSFGDDRLYATLAREYIEQLLTQGMNFECFIEGTRSRTGKLLPPKLGILKYILDALISGRVKDALIVPISIQYDKVIETGSYVNELLGNPKEKESLWGLATNTRVLQLKMGRIDVRFKKAYSLREYIQSQIKRRSTETRLAATPTTFDPQTEKDKIILLKSLGYKVLSDINEVSVIMPAALVGTCILTLRGRGVGRTELCRRVEWLKSAIEAKGGRVADFGGMSTSTVVERALEFLKDLVGEHRDLLESTFYAAKRFELSFFRNQVIHLFVSEAIMCVALYIKVKQGGPIPSQRMRMDELSEELGFMSRLLAGEFIYGTEGIDANLERTLDGLIKDEVLLAETNSEGIEVVGLSMKERRIGRQNYDTYCFLVWPFIETYWLAAAALFALTPRTGGAGYWTDEKDFHKRAQLFGKTLYFQGDISYFESINQATLLNAFTRLGELGIIISQRSRDGKVKAMIALAPVYLPTRAEDGSIKPEGRLWDFIERISKARREGKNRRDTETVAARVLKLADDLGALPVPDMAVPGEARL